MLRHRITSGCIIATGLALLVYYVPMPWVWFALLGISGWAHIEFYLMTDRAGIHSFKVVGVLAGFALLSSTFWSLGPSAPSLAEAYKWEQLVLMATLIAMFLRLFPRKYDNSPVSTIGCTLLGVFYVPFLLNFITRLGLRWEEVDRTGLLAPTGRFVVIYLALVVKMADVGAYFSGRFLGRHKLFPRISPAKTWEGFAGGVIAAVLSSVLFCWSHGWQLGHLGVPLVHATVLGIVLSAAGLAGDLFESLLKRATGIKDSSSSIPGMGGILDVLDSMLFGAPALYLYACLFLGSGG